MNTPRPYLVFADVDETLIRPKSLIDFLPYYFAGRHGSTGAERADTVLRHLAARIAAGEPRAALNRTYYRTWRGETATALHTWGRRWYAEQTRGGDLFIPATLQALRRHREQGATVVLVSGSFPPLLSPVAKAIGAAHTLCTRPAIQHGRLTGEITGPPMIGEAKRAAVRRILAEHPDVAPTDCYAYGDHPSDLPMLEEVGHAVIVGQNPHLHRALPTAAHLPTD
ncbi:HAD family hydrolase [Streptacidiphilus sp. MAP5-3]|uniref:HAD family hydrolase n=1 Tax=unclassified Streptacidiphilus TaxID=2643834 RepID=UPI003510E8C5